MVNITLANCVNLTTITWSFGPHNATIYVNDSSGNTNRTSVTFNVTLIKFNISGIVFNDTNYNGILNAGENGLANITLRAWNDANGNGSVEIDEILHTFATTNTTGGYNMSVNATEVIIQVSD